jgi:hypothetical protein
MFIINELCLLSRECFCAVDRSNVAASLVTAQNSLLTYLSFSNYVKRFLPANYTIDYVAFMSDELSMTWKIINELRRLCVTLIHVGYYRQMEDFAGCLC